LGKVPVLDIDVKGAIHVQKQLGDKSLSIFIMPPSVDALRERLLNRQTETPESIQIRIDKAAYEISFSNQFNAIVKNEVLETACNDAANLLMEFLGPDFTK
jgi:guanylate kinase